MGDSVHSKVHDTDCVVAKVMFQDHLDENGITFVYILETGTYQIVCAERELT